MEPPATRTQDLLEQLTYHWDDFLRPKLGGLTDEEYHWEPIDYQHHAWAATADEALVQLDDGYRRWIEGVAGLDDRGLAEPVGEAEGPFAAFPYSTLVLHIHREVIHHGAEVLLLRDLYRNR